MAKFRAGWRHGTALLLGLTALWGASAPARAQEEPAAGFTLIGHIERFTLDAAGDPLTAAVLTVRGIPVVLPRNLLITMPGRYMTAHDIFLGPAITGAPRPESGLALADQPPPRVPFEAELIGNITGGLYTAGVVRISQGALHIGSGFIQAIDPATGELRVGDRAGQAGSRVRLNDPTGIYSVANSARVAPAIPLDIRFALDPDNSPIHARTGFPVCIPRTSNPELCPAGNRPSAQTRRFTCARGTAPNLTGPAAPDAPSMACDPTRPVPLAVGDHVTYAGMLQAAPDGSFLIAAHGLEADLGIYTSPGAEPVYVFIEEAIQGTKGVEFAGFPQEETTRFRIVGFTTDPSRSIEVSLVDSDRLNVPGVAAETSLTGPAGLAPSNGPQLGRFRNTWPAKDDARAVRRDARVRVVNSGRARQPTGLTSGEYVAPIGEYIYPEPTLFGIRGFPVPVPFENFCFAANGAGSIATSGSANTTLGPLAPFPTSGHIQSQETRPGGARVCDGH